jgi:pyrroline-5-carboxylate reductase
MTAGKMGTSIAHALLQTPGFTVRALTRGQASCEALTAKFVHAASFTARTSNELQETLSQSEAIVLAPKLADAIPILRDPVFQQNVAGRLVVSVVFGLSAETIERELGPHHGAFVVSALPSILAEVRCSPTIVARAQSQQQDGCLSNLLRQILGALGPIVEVPRSNVVAAATLAGTLPALLSEYLQGLWTEAAVQGVEDDAIRQTMAASLHGVAEILAQGALPEDIVKRVATKGGVTEASLEILRRADVQATTREALSRGQVKLANLLN